MNPLQALLRDAFAQFGNRPALESPALALTYAELDRATAALASELLARGVRSGDVVPLFMARSAWLVLTEAALVRIGAAYAPIDLASPEARQRLMLDAIAPTLIATDGPPGPAHPAARFDVAAWWRSRDADASGLPVQALAAGLASPPSEACACVLFTSGSTGVPKGVRVRCASIARLVHSATHSRFAPGQRWAFVSSPAFDASTLEVWGPLLNGGCCVVQAIATPSLDVLGEFFTRQRITDTFLTSSLFNAMVDDQLPALGALVQLITGGERVSPTHARRLLLAHPGVQLINGYGPTESTTFAVMHRITLADTEPGADPDGDGGLPIGRPIDGSLVRIASDADETRDSGDADVGELWISGDGLALGYLADDALTQRKFVAFDGRRWYRTGDAVRRRADGLLAFVGRVDRQIKLRGHRIELEEVELALTRCAGIGDAAVLVLGDSADTRRLVAVYSPLGGADAVATDSDTLTTALRTRLPEPAVPTAFMAVASLPRTLNGKVDRAALEAVWGSLQARLQRVLAERATLPALESRSETLSYAELDRRSALLAAHLLALGVRAGDALPLIVPRSIFLVVAMLAAVRIGAVYVPIDMASPPARTARILGVLKPRFAVTDADGAIDGLGDCVRIDRAALPAALTAALTAALAAAPTATTATTAAVADVSMPTAMLPWAATPPDAPMYTMFTSGSTGVPKGVVVPSRGVTALVSATDWAGFPADARWLLVTSPAFDISNLEIWGALLNGACCIVLEGELPSLDELGRVLVERRISHAQMSTALFNAMVDTQLAAMRGLRQFITGGERASPPHMRRFLSSHPHVALINAYGPTETTIWSLARTVTLADTHEPAGIPIGRAVRGTSIRVEPVVADVSADVFADAEATADAAASTSPASERAIGGVGELLIAGAGVALGYLDDPAQTALRFVERDGQRWYRSGDLVRLRDDGVCEFRGRADRQVKVQGQRIEIDEVELTLASFPGVGEVAVLLRGDDAASRHLAACYAGLGGPAPDPAQVGDYLAAHLPAAALPKELQALDRLPRNVNGKVDRIALALMLDASRLQPEGTRAHDDAQATPALPGAYETELTEIWRELLPRVRVSRESHFLRIGGTSLLALQVAALVQRRLGRSLPPLDVLRHPVLAEQARQIAALEPGTPEPATEGGDTVDSMLPSDALAATMPLSQITLIALTRGQQGLLAASRLDPTGSAYLVHIGLHLPQALAGAAWRAAFEQLAQRHPALRVAASHNGLRAKGRLLPALVQGWWREHPALAGAPHDLDWPARLMAMINRPLDTRQHGSMRVDRWPLPNGESLLVWTVHHHAVDEASIDTALAELDALLHGRSLPPVYGSPFAFQAIEAAWSDPPALNAAWATLLAKTLAGATPPLERAPARGSERAFALPVHLQQRLTQRCAALGCTPFAVLLSAFGMALQDVFGPRFRFVSTPFSRRVEPELIEPIGYLLDMRFIEAGSRPSEAAETTLRRVHGALLKGQAPAFQRLDALTRAVAEQDAQAAQCLTQFSFTWRLDPARTVPIAGHTARLLRVPQAAARYSLSLHAARVADGIGYSIEAVEAAHTGGQVAAVARAFELHLATLCEPAAPLPAPASTSALKSSASKSSPLPGPTATEPDAEQAEEAAEEPALRTAWAHWLGLEESSVQPGSHFLRSGGSSLTAMRMAAELRRDHGLKLDVGAFLAHPTFERLLELGRDDLPRLPAGYVLLGPADFSHVMVLLPGAGGQAAGLYVLGDELQRHLPERSAVAIFDLDGALGLAPQADALWFVARRMLQMIRDLGRAKVTAVVGFSMGGGLALRLAQDLGSGDELPIWMLDTFAPGRLQPGLLRKLERNLAWLVFGDRPAANTPPAEAAPDTPQGMPIRAHPSKWQALYEQLDASRLAAPSTPVRLIQARSSVAQIGLVWQRSNNGFKPGDYASWRVRTIDGDHLDLPRHLAATTARLILDDLEADARQRG